MRNVSDHRLIAGHNGSLGYARGCSGFTLVELSIVLMIIVAVMGGAIMMLSMSLEDLSNKNTLAKLKTLQQALHDYRIAYNRLPCPANSSAYVPSDNRFAEGAATASNCTGGTPAADMGNATAAVGMVPVRDLGLPDDMAFDSWGRRIRYAVSPDYVTTNAFDNVPRGDNTVRLTVKNNDSDLTIADTAAYVLVSYGANGHGARGGMTGTLLNAGSTNAGELLNCKCTSSAVADTSTPGTFVQGGVKPDPNDPLNNFDDIVVFATRSELRNATE